MAIGLRVGVLLVAAFTPVKHLPNLAKQRPDTDAQDRYDDDCTEDNLPWQDPKRYFLLDRYIAVAVVVGGDEFGGVWSDAKVR